MKKKTAVIIIVVMLLIIPSMIVTDGVRFINNKTPIFAMRIIPVYDADIYYGFGYSIIYGYKGDEVVSEWRWFDLF